MSFFRSTRTLTLEAADEISNKIIDCCRKNQFNPLTITIVDASSNIILQKRMDGCPSGAFDKFSQAKATAAASLMIPSRNFSKKYAVDDHSKMLQGISMVGLTNNTIAPFPGGIVLRDIETNDVLGAVGCSGAAGDEDEYCALIGVQKSSFASKIVTDPVNHSCTTYKE